MSSILTSTCLCQRGMLACHPPLHSVYINTTTYPSATYTPSSPHQMTCTWMLSLSKLYNTSGLVGCAHTASTLEEFPLNLASSLPVLRLHTITSSTHCHMNSPAHTPRSTNHVLHIPPNHS